MILAITNLSLIFRVNCQQSLPEELIVSLPKITYPSEESLLLSTCSHIHPNSADNSS